MSREAPARLEATATCLLVEYADLSGSEFTDVNLADSRFRDINLSGTTFDNITLADSRIHDANLSGLQISNCRVEGMTIEGVAVTDLFAAYRSARGSL